MVKLVNRAKMKVASGGAGTLTLGTACDGYQTFAAGGVTDQDKLRYTITDGDDWEIGVGTYTASGTTLARAVTESSNSGNAITCGSEAEIFVTMAAEDFSDNAAPSFSNTIPDTLELGAGVTSTINAKALDDDGFPITYSFDAFSGNTVYSASSLPPQFTSVTVDQTTGVFSLAVTSSASNGGSVNLRVRASDGVRTATKKIFCNLSFLPLSGLKALYDMKDSSSYSGTGTSWYDISGNSGPTLSINLSHATYNSSGYGGIPQLEITSGNTATGANTSSVINSPSPFLTYDATTLKTTVAMIFAKVPEAGWLAQSSYDFPVSAGTNYSSGWTGSSTLEAGNSTANALQVSSSAQHAGVASSTSKLYIDKVDQTSISMQDFKDGIGDTNNREIYHSIVLTDAWFNGGFYWNNGYSFTTAYGNLRAIAFWDRALTQAEVTGLHAHFAGDYTSSEMIQ
jgi:hypothetical protein